MFRLIIILSALSFPGLATAVWLLLWKVRKLQHRLGTLQLNNEMNQRYADTLGKRLGAMRSENRALKEENAKLRAELAARGITGPGNPAQGEKND